MDNKEKESGEKKFCTGGFDLGKFGKMAEMMGSCCTGEGGMAECCSMMKKMMEHALGKEKGEKNKGTAEKI